MTFTGFTEDFPYESKYMEVNGNLIHYIDEGQGTPVVFVHGLPTWSYLWRNIIPFVSDSYRCIALDLIGMGKSDKPDIEYTVANHVDYFDEFMKQLDLEPCVIVCQGWGSLVSIDWAMRNQEKVKGLCVMEGYLVPPHDIRQVPLTVQEYQPLWEHDIPKAKRMVLEDNFLVESFLSIATLRTYSQKELSYYRLPFMTEDERKPLLYFVKEFPRPNENSEVNERFERYSAELQKSTIPKLLFYGMPGWLMPVQQVMWCKDNFPNLTLMEVGESLHYLPEDQPQFIGEELRLWLFEKVFH